MVLDDEKKKEIGKRIQKTRKELGFKNGHAFYDFVFGDGEIKTDNKKDSVISEWENGKRYIDLDHLMLAADKLGVSLDYLVYGKGEEERTPTLREICENVARFFFLAKAEIVENGDCIEMKFYKRKIADYAYCFAGFCSEEWEKDLGKDEDYLSMDIRKFCKDLGVVRAIDNRELAEVIPRKKEKLPQYNVNAARCGREISKDKWINEQLSNQLLNNHWHVCPLSDSPYTENAMQYLKICLEKIPQYPPKEIFRRCLEDANAAAIEMVADKNAEMKAVFDIIKNSQPDKDKNALIQRSYQIGKELSK